jgi:hypothetical protein
MAQEIGDKSQNMNERAKKISYFKSKIVNKH